MGNSRCLPFCFRIRRRCRNVDGHRMIAGRRGITDPDSAAIGRDERHAFWPASPFLCRQPSTTSKPYGGKQPPFFRSDLPFALSARFSSLRSSLLRSLSLSSIILSRSPFSLRSLSARRLSLRNAAALISSGVPPFSHRSSPRSRDVDVPVLSRRMFAPAASREMERSRLAGWWCRCFSFERIVSLLSSPDPFSPRTVPGEDGVGGML